MFAMRGRTGQREEMAEEIDLHIYMYTHHTFIKHFAVRGRTEQRKRWLKKHR
jgi:hypothetical protein